MRDMPTADAMQAAIKMLAYRVRLTGAMTENIPSPCVSVCRMHADSGLCQGCFRTLDEIRAWSTASDASKKAVWSALTQRLRQAHPHLLPERYS